MAHGLLRLFVKSGDSPATKVSHQIENNRCNLKTTEKYYKWKETAEHTNAESSNKASPDAKVSNKGTQDLNQAPAQTLSSRQGSVLEDLNRRASQSM